MSLDIYEAFMQIVEQGSISAAARVLSVPRPTISRRLTRLEERVGERLVQRGSHQIVVTRAGRALYQRVRGPLADLQAAERSITDASATPKGLLRVAIPPLMVDPLTPVLLEFQRKYPDVSLEIITETRYASLTAEGFDVAIRGGVLRNPDLIQRRLLTLGVGLVASPAYLERHGTPTQLADLAHHELLRSYDNKDRPRAWWPLREGGRFAVDGSFITNDRRLLLAIAIAGGGIALLSENQYGLPIRTGELVRVLPDPVGTTIGLYVVYPDRAILTTRSRVFVDAVIQFASQWKARPAEMLAGP